MFTFIRITVIKGIIHILLANTNDTTIHFLNIEHNVLSGLRVICSLSWLEGPVWDSTWPWALGLGSQDPLLCHLCTSL